jgi:hypothetical protein
MHRGFCADSWMPTFVLFWLLLPGEPSTLAVVCMCGARGLCWGFPVLQMVRSCKLAFLSPTALPCCLPWINNLFMIWNKSQTSPHSHGSEAEQPPLPSRVGLIFLPPCLPAIAGGRVAGAACPTGLRGYGRWCLLTHPPPGLSGRGLGGLRDS